MIHLNEFCEILLDLTDEFEEELGIRNKMFLQIPLWQGDASNYFCDFKIERIKGAHFLRSDRYVYDPRLFIIRDQPSFRPFDARVPYFKSEKVVIEELIKIECEEFSPRTEGPMRIYTSSFLLVSLLV